MTTFQLQITIDSAGLQTLSGTGASIAILVPQSSSANQIVAVLTAPLNNTQITWTDSFAVYTSSYSLQPYSVLKINSQQTAYAGLAYSFNGSLISQSGSAASQDCIQLTNDAGATVTAGLAKTFTVGGQQQAAAITTASSLLPTGLGTFSVSNQIMVTLMTGAEVGMAVPTGAFPGLGSISKKRTVPQVTVQPPLFLTFSASNSIQSICLNDQNCQFYACS